MSTVIADRGVYLEAVGLAAPGLPDWQAGLAVLRGEIAYAQGELQLPQPASLPPNERRRASAAVRLAFAVAEQVTAGSDTSSLALVVASADGDLGIAERICRALAAPGRMVSPTDFHASVHNAVAGNWSIAAAARGPSTAVAGYEGTFANGLMEAVGMVMVERVGTLLVAFDLRPPELLASQSVATGPMAVALLLAPVPSQRSLARLQIVAEGGAEDELADVALEALRRSGPAARCLPLLQSVARQERATVRLPSNLAGTPLSVGLEPY